tara:strand:+ start:286 stop:1113 length:828 start_codon:yes stop_codon:yes gene_type:complete
MSTVEEGLNALLDENYELAVEILIPLSKKDNADALYYLSHLFYFGLGVIQNLDEYKKLDKKAFKKYKELAEQNIAERKNWGEDIKKLGEVLSKSRIGSNYFTYIEQIKWLKLAYEHGCTHSSFALGQIFNEGEKMFSDTKNDNIFPAINKKEAFKYYMISANQGRPEAMLNVANAYRNGFGIKQDNFEALKWYNTAIECYKLIKNYSHESEWEDELLPAAKYFMSSIKSKLKSSEIFEAKKLANEFKKINKEKWEEVNVKNDLNRFWDFIDRVSD